MAAALRDALFEGVLAGRDLLALSSEQVDQVTGPPLVVARAMAADEVLTSRLDCRDEGCNVALRRVRGTDGAILGMGSFQVPLDRPDLLPQTVPGFLARIWPEKPWSHGARAAVRSEDYRRYLEIRQALNHSQDPRSVTAWIDELTAISRRSPGLVSAALLAASTASYRFQTRRDPRDLERAWQILDDARKAAPDHPRPLAVLFDVALRSEQLAKAEEALRQLEALQPGNAELLGLEGRLAEHQGRGSEALELLRRRARQRPSWYNLYQLADLEYRKGQPTVARQHLTELLARNRGYTAAVSLLAQVELQYGSLERAVQLYEDLVRRSPGMEEESNLGNAYLLLGRLPEAETAFRRAVALAPGQPFALLNLADFLALTGRKAESSDLYRRTIELIDRDPARDNWQMHSVRAQALAHLGRSAEAVADVQQVLARESDNPQALYEIAVVYTLLGERLSARVSAEKALAGGMAPRWFRLPWLAPLLADAELASRLAQAEARTTLPP